MSKWDSESMQWAALKVAGKVGASLIFPWAAAALDAAEGVYNLSQGDTKGACVNFGSAVVSCVTGGLHISGNEVVTETTKKMTQKTTETFVKNNLATRVVDKAVTETCKTSFKQTQLEIVKTVGLTECGNEGLKNCMRTC